MYIVAGAHSDDDKGTDSGSVVVWEFINDSYIYKTKLTDNNGSNNDNLGLSVAISANGEYIVAGAQSDDDKGNNSGSVVVWRLVDDSYNQIQKLTDNDGSNDDVRFISSNISNGKYIVAGATGDDDKGNNSGSVVVWKWDDGDGSYNQIQKLTDSSGDMTDYLGTSVAISANGEYIVSGAYKDVAGSVVVWKWDDGDGSYNQIQKLTDDDSAMNDNLGTSVAISANGEYIVAGAPEDDDKGTDSGSVVVWEFINDSYIYKTKLTDSSGVMSGKLGKSVAISQDGTYIVAGAPGDDDKGFGSGSVVGWKWIIVMVIIIK